MVIIFAPSISSRELSLAMYGGSKSQVSLSRAFLANVHNVAKFRFRTNDANDARDM